MLWPAAATGVVRVLASHDVILWVRHQSEYDTRWITNTGDIADGAVGIGAPVAQRHLAGNGERLGVRMDISAFTVRDRTVDWVLDSLRPHTGTLFYGVEYNPATIEVALRVVPECTRKQPGAGEYLESVADTDEWPTCIDKATKFLAEADHQVECEHAARTE